MAATPSPATSSPTKTSPAVSGDLLRHYQDLYVRITAAGISVRDTWPAGIPGPKRLADMTAEQFETARTYLDRHDPTFVVAPDLDADMGAVKALRAKYEALPDDARRWVAEIVLEAAVAGVPIGVNARPSRRNFEIARALIALGADYDLVRALASLAMNSDDPLMPVFTVGSALGGMTLDEAARFAAFTDTFLDDGLFAVIGDDGFVRLAAA